MVFGKIVGPIGAAWTPEDMKLALSYPILDPIKPHVDGLGPFLFDSVIGDAAGSAVVGLEWCGWLGVAKFFQSNLEWADGLCVEE